jgi:hypothetical protein
MCAMLRLRYAMQWISQTPSQSRGVRRAKKSRRSQSLKQKVPQSSTWSRRASRTGECVAAQRVSPDRVKLMADKLAVIRKHLLAMEHDLRRVATQTEMTLEIFR